MKFNIFIRAVFLFLLFFCVRFGFVFPQDADLEATKKERPKRVPKAPKPKPERPRKEPRVPKPKPERPHKEPRVPRVREKPTPVQKDEKPVRAERRAVSKKIGPAAKVRGYNLVVQQPKLSTKNNKFVISGSISSEEKPASASVILRGSGMLSDVVYCIIKSWSKYRIVAEIPYAYIRKMKNGFYDVSLQVGKDTFSVKNRIILPGISGYDFELGASSANLISNSSGSNTVLVIKGAGFGASNIANSVTIGGKYKVSQFYLWNDSIIKLQLPLNVKGGFSYQMLVKNFLGVEYDSKSDSNFTLRYPGISSVKIYGDDNNTVWGEIFGLEMGSDPKVSSLFFNDVKITKIITWTPKYIKFSIDFMRSGRYLPYVVTRKPSGNQGDFLKVTLFANDSIDFFSYVKHEKKKISGAYYALSLRESGVSSGNSRKSSGYSSFVYTIPQDAYVGLNFYSQDGLRRLMTVFSKEQLHSKGRYEVQFRTSDIPYGKYILLLEIDDKIKIPYPFIR